MTNVLLRRAALALALTAALAACGKDQAPEAPQAAAASAAEATAPAENVGRADAAPVDAEQAPLAASDLEAYARGMQQEVALLKAAGDKIAQARSGNDKDAEASAMMEMANLDTTAEGAKAAALSPARYGFVKDAVDTALGKLEMQGAMQAMGDSSQSDELTPEQRQQAEAGRAEVASTIGDPYQGMAADVAEAFKARQQALAQLRAQAIAARFEAAR